ncbi:MAG TPA: hypothetical protein DEA44_00375 [Firmicutes bacterium]|nr:hypothetical protein [Bacillota bacterium]HWR57002.1 hypothetical protein [Negativicutes bacterium]
MGAPGENKVMFLQRIKEKIWEPACCQSVRLWAGCKNFMVGLIYENGDPSLTRVISIVAFLAFLAASAYLIIAGKRWDHYDTFATLTGGGGAATQVANKVINSVYNSSSNQYPKKGEGNNG